MRSLVLITLAAAAPAGAQIVGEHDYGHVPRIEWLGRGDSRLPGPGVFRDLAEVCDRIDDAKESNRISEREARAYRRDARLIGGLAARYGRDGLSPAEANELEMRTRVLRARVVRPTSRRP
jgi:hypothetical protein